MLATLNLTESEIKDDMLNLANLSQLYRIVSFAKALRLSIRDFLLVKALIGTNPFDAAHTENTLLFVEKVRKIGASGFTIAALDYLLRDHVVPPSGIAPTEESIALVLDQVRSGLQKIAADNLPVADPTGDVTRTKLATLPDITAELLPQAMALIVFFSSASAAEQDQFIDAHFASFLDPADAKAKLVGPPRSVDSASSDCPIVPVYPPAAPSSASDSRARSRSSCSIGSNPVRSSPRDAIPRSWLVSVTARCSSAPTWPHSSNTPNAVPAY